MDFPAYSCKPIPVTSAMQDALCGILPVEAFVDRDLLMVLESEEQVRGLKPDIEKMKLLPGLTIAVTAKGQKYDCVSRCFAPELSPPEDAVTGSTHCMITPYWCERLGKSDLVCYQASERGGILYTRQQNGRILIAGSACLFSVAELAI
jgi:predicted PhzF superfamily epimerase YddE/YHI9